MLSQMIQVVHLIRLLEMTQLLSETSCSSYHPLTPMQECWKDG